MPLGDGNYIFFTVSHGEIWFTRRALDGTWVPVVHEQNPQLPGEAAAQAISTRGIFELQHLAVVADGGELWHSLWNSQGQATAFGDVQATAAGRVGGFMDVDASHGPSGELFVVACTVDGKLWDTTRDPNGTWRPFEDMKALANPTNIVGNVRNISCTTEEPSGGSGHAFHVVALTEDYHLFHSRYINSSTFSTFLDIESTAAGEAGNFTDVSCAWDGSCLHVCAVTGGTLRHTMMLPDMTWTPFVDVKTLARTPDPGVIEKVACGVPGTPPAPGPVTTGCNLLLAAPVVVARRVSRRRRSDPINAAAPTPLEVVVLTSARQAWYVERGSDGTWTTFMDIEATAAGTLGTFGARPFYVAL